MNKKIIFQKCNFNNIYFLLYIIIYILEASFIIPFTLKNYLDKYPEKNGKNYFLFLRQIIITYLSNITDFIEIIPYFIRKKLIKKNDVSSKKIESLEMAGDNNKYKEKNELIYNDIKISETQKIKKLLIIYLALIGIFDFLKNFIEIINVMLY